MPPPLLSYCTQCRTYGHSDATCHWMARMAVMIRHVTAPLPNKRKAHRAGKGRRGNRARNNRGANEAAGTVPPKGD
ncbi:hypothetical protein E8E15_001881 [Penicillium rubens]|nr:hypothetical protein E8E15_001881 [Penicillium rubens]